jgi:glutamine amidotransferase
VAAGVNVAIIDYAMSNLGSARRAFEECGANVTVTDQPGDLRGADRIVLPGVGAFGDGMRNLEAGGWIPAMKEALENPRVNLLGICLGMQLLASKGLEGGENRGLDFIPGEVRRLEPLPADARIPHVGWNELQIAEANPLFTSIANGTDFYFVHSYHFAPADAKDALAWTPYCGKFVSAVRRGNVYGVQFHPEKSSRPGFQLLKNFLAA